MTDRFYSRRHFLQLAGAGLGAGLGAVPFLNASAGTPASPMTVQEVIDLIIGAVPGGRLQNTVDTVKLGDAGKQVTGVVTTFLATYAVLRRAAELNANLVITHEPTFYNHHDEVDWLDGDPVYQAKRKMAERHGIVVWRFHDYWHRHQPDGIQQGFLQQFNRDWTADPEDQYLYTVPNTTLAQLAANLKGDLELERVRVVGQPEMPVSRVGFLLGAVGGRRQIEMLSRSDIDVLVVGEVNEWESSEYVRDAVDAGINKGLVILGHANSEEPGMGWFADWLQERLPAVKVTHVPAQDPFWQG